MVSIKGATYEVVDLGYRWRSNYTAMTELMLSLGGLLLNDAEVG
jgi:hypothetical protein